MREDCLHACAEKACDWRASSAAAVPRHLDMLSVGDSNVVPDAETTALGFHVRVPISSSSFLFPTSPHLSLPPSPPPANVSQRQQREEKSFLKEDKVLLHHTPEGTADVAMSERNNGDDEHSLSGVLLCC